MRLINADEVRKKAVPHTRGEHGYSADIRKWAVLVGDIDDAPTIDAVPVVRCKDCNKSEPSNVWDGWIYCTANAVHQKDDNFCSYGERKDGEG